MRIDVSQRIGICYKDERWAREVMDQICRQLPDKMIFKRTSDRIEFIDGSYVVAFAAKDQCARGRALDRIFVQEGVDEEYIDTCLKPTLRRHQIQREVILSPTSEVYFW